MVDGYSFAQNRLQPMRLECGTANLFSSTRLSFVNAMSVYLLLREHVQSIRLSGLHNITSWYLKSIMDLFRRQTCSNIEADHMCVFISRPKVDHSGF